MSFQAVTLTPSSWVPAVEKVDPARFLPKDELRNITRDFSKCFETSDLTGLGYYWMSQSWYNFALPFADIPSLTEHNTSAIMELRLQAVRYSYNSELSIPNARFRGHNFTELGEWTGTQYEDEPGVEPQNCDVIKAVLKQPYLPITIAVQQDGNKNIAGDFVISETPDEGGMVVLVSQIVVPTSTDYMLSRTTHLTSSVASSVVTVTISATVDTSPGVKSNTLGGVSQSIIIAVSIGGTLAVLFALIGVALVFRRRKAAHRQTTLSPVPLPAAPAAVGLSKIEMALAVLADKAASEQPSASSSQLLERVEVDPNEEYCALTDLRRAMQNSGHTIYTLFASLGGLGAAGRPEVSDKTPDLPGYDHVR